MSEDRIKIAYNTFRSGFSDPTKCPAPSWNDAPAWVRDVVTVAYLQGKLDRSDWPEIKTPATIEELQAILNSEDDRPITINPDGSITAE
jgi:hypothetical protein